MPLRRRSPEYFRAVLAVTLLAAGCLPPDPPDPSPRPHPTTSPGRKPNPTSSPSVAPAELPSFSIRITDVSPRWTDALQRFTLVLTNTGTHKAKVHAIVYAVNDSSTPPRRALSPATASSIWFRLAGSRDGKIDPYDIDRNWRSDEFVTAKLGKLRRTWEVDLEPGREEKIEAHHDFEDVSPFPAFKGKKFPAKTAYTQYFVWLFTPDGYCFAKQEFKLEGGTAVAVGGPPPKVIPTETKPEPKPATVSEPKPSTRPEPPPEIQAAALLRLANHYLDKNQPDDAREQLEKIVTRFPTTEASKTARQMLKSMNKG